MSSLPEEVAQLRGTRPATFGDLLRHRSFSRLWRAMLVSSLGDWVGFVAVTILVQRADIGGAVRPEFAVAGVMIARLLPSIVFGPFAGVLVDRFDRRKLMVFADVSRGVLYASLPFLPSLWAIYGLSFVIECFSLLWTPARDASIPNLVPRRQLANANTIGLATTYGTLPLGGIVFTGLAGIAAALSGAVPYLAARPESLPLWLNGLTFGFSAFMISGISGRVSARRPAGKLVPGQAMADFREGVRYLRTHTFARAMTIGIVLAFTGVGSVIGLGPIFARVTLQAGAAGWGVLVSAVGVGLALGMGSLGWMSKFVGKYTLFPAAMLVAAVMLMVLALMPSLFPAAMVTTVMGMAAGITWVAGYTMLHENISDELRGRTFASLTVLSRVGLFLSLAGFPALAGAIGSHRVALGAAEINLVGTRLALWAGALLVLLGSVLARRGLRRSRLAAPRQLVLRPRLRKVERNGTFIVFEGVEGSGKGTQIARAAAFLRSEHHDVLVTREPGGTDLGERLRDALLEAGGNPVDARAEALLFAASRAQHVSSVIRPALEAGKVILCDRYVDSSLAYQGVGRGLGEQDVLTLNAWATQGLFPDLVILLNVDAEVGLARSSDKRDRIEAEGEKFMTKVADAYMHIAEEHPERFVVLDASASPEQVHEQVRHAILRYLRSEED